MQDNKIFYRRNLPHYQPAYATYFTTFPVNGLAPAEVIARMKEKHRQNERLLLKIRDEKIRKQEILDMHKRHFGNFDEMLDQAANNKNWLRDDRVAQVIIEAMHFRDKKTYNLLAYYIMPIPNESEKKYGRGRFQTCPYTV
ncbi:MAG: hypothetical protein B6D35_05045 [Candidatus Brocadia sp. UTAMX2]|jgi:hypothetical protein|nr:MAG: hypothetical protein B6D35_05045 [Candidatus Brocadia sp. UTAMX2]